MFTLSKVEYSWTLIAIFFTVCMSNSAYRNNITYVSLRLRMQNAVPAQPCVGKYWISLILLNFLHCNFRLWFKTPQPFDSYPCHASEVTRNTLNHCLKFTVRSIFCHICYGKISEKNVNTFFKVKLFVSKTSDSCFKVLICFKCS